MELLIKKSKEVGKNNNMKDFLTDLEMQGLEKKGVAKTPDFISDEEMSRFDTRKDPARIAQLQTEAEAAQQEAQKQGSVWGMTKNFLKALPKATTEVLAGNPVQFGVSALAAPIDITRGVMGKEPMKGTYKIPGLEQRGTLQSEATQKYEELSKGEGSDTMASLKMGGELLKTPLAGMETATGFTGLTKTLPSALERRISARALANKQKDLEKVIDVVAPKLTPTELSEALSKGKVQTKTSPITKKITADFSKDPQISKIAEDTRDVIKPGNTFAANLKAVRNKIEEISNKVISPFLEKEKVPFNYEDFIGKMKLVKPSVTFTSEGTKSFQTYNNIREQVINVVASDLKNTAKAKGDFGNLTDFNDIWNARKKLEQVAEEQLKNFSFGTPEYSGAKAAIQDMRKGFKEFILDSLQYPGQMEKVNKMQEFLSVFQARGGSLNDEASAIKALQKEFGISNTPKDVARMAFFRNQMEKLSSFLEAKTNISAKVGKEIGTTAFSRFGKKHPTITKGLKYTGIGLLGGLGLEGGRRALNFSE